MASRDPALGLFDWGLSSRKLKSLSSSERFLLCKIKKTENRICQDKTFLGFKIIFCVIRIYLFPLGTRT